MARQDFYIKKLEEKLNIDSLKDYLYDLYVIQKKTTREIADIVYGKPKNSPNILNWLHYFNIPVRKGSEAIKVQYIGKKGERRREIARNRANTSLQSKQSRDKLREIMQTDEYREKQKQAHLGEKNGMYNPNLSDEDRLKRQNDKRDDKYDYWRRKVYEKDHFTCQITGKTSNLVAHHLEGYNWCKEKRFDVDNGITLHVSIHKCFHHFYGYGNNTKEQFKEFVENYNNGLYDEYLKEVS